MIRLLAALLFCSCTAAHADTPIPQTPAGRVFSEWLAAFNSAERGLLQSFKDKYRRETTVEQNIAAFEETGGYRVIQVATSEPLSIAVVLQERDSDSAIRMTLSLDKEDPKRIANVEVEESPLPAGFAIAPMAEADALSALAARTDDLGRRDRFSGAVLVARRGEVLLQRAWGLADREAKTPASLDTRFRLGSMNKMFTAVATLQLIEAGKLSLDSTVASVLPAYPNRTLATKVTVRHLLTHTGGTGDIFGPEFDTHRTSLKTHADYLKLFGSRAPEFEPGTQSRYSNYGYVLLGAMIEQASGQSYYDYVRERVFVPAGMDATGSEPESEAVSGRAAGYTRKDGAWVSNADSLPYRGTACGGGYSTVGDLLRFARALESGKLLSKASVAAATRLQHEGSRRWYGYGFFVRGEGDRASFGHAGGAQGMNGELRIYPASGTVVIALSNLDPPAASRPVDYFELRMPATR